MLPGSISARPALPRRRRATREPHRRHPSPTPAASPAAYVRPDAFTETEVTVGAAPWALPGTLSMPTGSGPFPAVVLVAGSGPQDRDETLGPNAPLRDLAWGLASNGIAVLRYDKRTKAHGPEMASEGDRITVARGGDRRRDRRRRPAARDAGVDPERVFVAGHSLGGYLAPRIAAAAPERVAGIALLEANARPLQRLIEDQLTYLSSDAGGADPSGEGDAGHPAGPAGARRLAGPLTGDACVEPAARGARCLLAGPAHLRPRGDRSWPVGPHVHHPGRQGLPGAPDGAGGVAHRPRRQGRRDRPRVPVAEPPAAGRVQDPAGRRSTRNRVTWRRR